MLRSGEAVDNEDIARQAVLVRHCPGHFIEHLVLSPFRFITDIIRAIRSSAGISKAYTFVPMQVQQPDVRAVVSRSFALRGRSALTLILPVPTASSTGARAE